MPRSDEPPGNGVLEYLKEQDRAKLLGQVSGFGVRLEDIASKIDKELVKVESELERSSNEYDARLREVERTCTAQEVKINALEDKIKENDQHIRDLEKWQNSIKGAIVAISVFVSAVISIIAFLIGKMISK